MTLEELEARVRRLEDTEQIKKLKATYCFLCDAGLEDERNREELMAHFSADARVDFGLGPASVFEGREGLEIFFGQVTINGFHLTAGRMTHEPSCIG